MKCSFIAQTWSVPNQTSWLNPKSCDHMMMLVQDVGVCEYWPREIICARFDTIKTTCYDRCYRFPVCKWQPQSYDHIMAYQKDASTPQSVSVCAAERDHIKNNCVSIFRMSKEFIQEHGKSNFLIERGINHQSRSGESEKHSIQPLWICCKKWIRDLQLWRPIQHCSRGCTEKDDWHLPF